MEVGEIPLPRTDPVDVELLLPVPSSFTIMKPENPCRRRRGLSKPTRDRVRAELGECVQGVETTRPQDLADACVGRRGGSSQALPGHRALVADRRGRVAERIQRYAGSANRMAGGP
jgi:hypothetical protein